MGTLGRSKKKEEELRRVENEGKHAIDSPGMPKSAEMPPEVSLYILNHFKVSFNQLWSGISIGGKRREIHD